MKTYCWISEDLKKSLDETLDEEKLKDYFVTQYGEEDTQTMYKLGLYTFAGKEGLILAIPGAEGQQQAASKYESVQQLQEAFAEYIERTAQKHLGKEDGIDPSFSSFIIYDGGLERMVGEIKDAVRVGREVDHDLLERAVKPYLGLAGIISSVESRRSVSKDDFDAVMPPDDA